MSTKFGVVTQSLYEGGDENEIVEVAYRSMGGIRWTNPLGPLLPDELEVEAMDNTPQGIYTIGDIKKEIKNHE